MIFRGWSFTRDERNVAASLLILPARAEDQLCKAACGFWPDIANSSFLLSFPFGTTKEKLWAISCHLSDHSRNSFSLHIFCEKKVLYASVVFQNDATSPGFASSELLFWSTPLWASFPATGPSTRCTIHTREIPNLRKKNHQTLLVFSGVTSSAQSKPLEGNNQAVWGTRSLPWGATTADSLLKHHLPMEPMAIVSPTLLIEPNPTTSKSTEKQNNKLKTDTQSGNGFLWINAGILQPASETRSVFQSPSWPRKKKLLTRN